MLEKLNKATEDARYQLESRKQEFKRLEESLLNPPVNLSLDEIRNQIQTRRHELTAAQESLQHYETAFDIFTGFQIKYSAYGAAYQRAAIEATQEADDELRTTYDNFHRAIADVSKNPVAVSILRAGGFEEFFPKKDKGEVQLSQDEASDLHTYQRLLNEFMSTLNSDTHLDRNYLLNKYYPNMDRKVANTSLSNLIRYVRTVLKPENLDIINLTPQKDIQTGKISSKYKLVQTGQSQEKRVPKKDNKDQPIPESRLRALTYIATQDMLDPLKIIHILGKTGGNKRKPVDLTPYQATVALYRSTERLYKKFELKLLTKDEERTLHILVSYFNKLRIAPIEFKDKILIPLFQPTEKSVSADSTKQERKDYLDQPVIGDSPFTNRDAICLAYALNHHAQELTHFCPSCEPPTKEAIDKFNEIFQGEVYPRQRTDSPATSALRDFNIMSGRLEAIKHFASWENMEGFEDHFQNIAEESINAVVYAMYSLSLTKNVDVNSEKCNGLTFLYNYFGNEKFRTFVDKSFSSHLASELNQGKPSAMKTSELEKKDPGVRETVKGIIEEVRSKDEFKALVNNAQITRVFSSVKSELVDDWLDKKYIKKTDRSNRDIPLFDNKQIVAMIYLSRNRIKGGLNRQLTDKLSEVIDELLTT